MFSWRCLRILPSIRKQNVLTNQKRQYKRNEILKLNVSNIKPFVFERQVQGSPPTRSIRGQSTQTSLDTTTLLWEYWWMQCCGWIKTPWPGLRPPSTALWRRGLKTNQANISGKALTLYFFLFFFLEIFYSKKFRITSYVLFVFFYACIYSDVKENIRNFEHIISEHVETYLRISKMTWQLFENIWKLTFSRNLGKVK